MSPHYTYTSPYYAAVREACRQLIGQGSRAFTQHDVARAIGRKVTPSLRNALRAAEGEGLIQSFRYFTERNGVGLAYVAADLEAVQMPFAAEKIGV